MAGKDLDNLAKGLAEERISRGKALKRMGAALLGGSLLAAFQGVAFAQPECGPNRPCAEGCTCVNAPGGHVCQCPGPPPCCPKGTNISSPQCSGVCCDPFKPNRQGKCVGG
jgi:hypothetical protein